METRVSLKYFENDCRNFVKLTGKHMCQRLFFKKVADLKHATLLKKSF